MTGHGTYYSKNGDKYDGDWLNNKEHGQGTQYYNDGGVYEGCFENGFK